MVPLNLSPASRVVRLSKDQFDSMFEQLRIDIEFMKNQLAYVETLTVNKDGTICL